MTSQNKVLADAVGHGSRRHIFHVEAYDVPEVLLRVVGPFAPASADLCSLVLERRPSRISIRVETETLDQDRATKLASRLQCMPCVISVGLESRTRSSETELRSVEA